MYGHHARQRRIGKTLDHQSPLEKMVSLDYFKKYFKNKKVFITGHTGFKGSWLLQILALCEANIHGYALAPEQEHDLFYQINGEQLCSKHILHDICDVQRLTQEIVDFQPDYIFHLAAQPLVLKGYQEPLYTFAVNTQGTANVLDAIRQLKNPCIAIMVTTDKVYENLDNAVLFTETDKLGGYDPYSASKAACEIVISSYRSSFFNDAKYNEHQKSIASVRAGNVIGGGDFAPNRIVPDIIRAISNNETVTLRNPAATRPWQHVIEPLGAYLLLACKMKEEPIAYNSAFNIGPEEKDVLSVQQLTEIAIAAAGKGSMTIEEKVHKPHEAATLMLDINKVKTQLGWTPKFHAAQAIQHTVAWYLDTAAADVKCVQQIRDYFSDTIEE